MTTNKIVRFDRRDKLIEKIESLPKDSIVHLCYTVPETGVAGINIHVPDKMTVADARALLFEQERLKHDLLGIASHLNDPEDNRHD